MVARQSMAERSMTRSQPPTGQPGLRAHGAAPRRLAPNGPARDVMVGPIRAIPDLLREHGVDPAPVLQGAGLDPRLFDDAGNRAELSVVGRLLEECARLTGCARFGLRVGERCELSGFGALGELMTQCETVGAALRSLARFLHVNDRSAVVVLSSPSPTRAALGYSILDGSTPATAQIHDAVIAIGLRILRTLGDAAWVPLEVRLAYAAPADETAFLEVFGVTPRFDASLSAVVFPVRWLEQRIAGADPARHVRIAHAIAEHAAREGATLCEQVRRALRAGMVGGPLTAVEVAREFATHERTLRRHLAAEGTSLQRLANEARFEVAMQLLRDTNRTVAEIAAAIGYADAAALSRACRNWSGATPSEWRARSRQAPPRGAAGSARGARAGATRQR